jgi:membrane associated rhomboid family serine protease
MKAKYLVLIFMAIELYLGFLNKAGDNIAHFAHLGGMLFGLIFILIWGKFDYNRWN